MTFSPPIPKAELELPVAATVSMGERDFLLMPASCTGARTEDLLLCFPKGLVFHLMDAAGGVVLVPTAV